MKGRVKGARSRAVLSALLVLLLLPQAACSTLSVEEEREIGHQAQRAFRQQYVLMRDRVVVNYVRKLGERLSDAADETPFELRFYVVEDRSINAAALPGGAIYINTGVLLEAQDVSQVAGVIAHEIGHVTARHMAQLYNRNRYTSFATTAVGLLVMILTGNPYVANASAMAGDIAGTAYTSTYGRDAEREADALAIETLIRAGYDPRGMPAFFDQLKKTSADRPFAVPDWLMSHPMPEERAETVRHVLATRDLPPELEQTDSGRLQIIQKRIELVSGTDDPDS